jgi:hypothetical protein
MSVTGLAWSDKNDLLSGMEGMDMLELPISSESWTWKGTEYGCTASGVEINNVEGVVDASEGVSLYVSKDC